jgi:hypothetical protein
MRHDRWHSLDFFRARLVFPSACSFALVLLGGGALGAGGAALALEPSPQAAGGAARAERDKKESGEWLALAAGLERMRERYQPAIVWYPGPAGSPGPALEEMMKEGGFRRTLGRFVLIRLEPADLEKAYPPRPLPELPEGEPGAAKGKQAETPKRGGAKGRPGGGDKPAPKEEGKQGAGEAPADGEVEPPEPGETAGGVLKIPSGVRALVALSFREIAVRRYDLELPKASVLQRELDRIWKVNDVQVQVARQVEKMLDASLKSYKLGDTRAAVLAVRDLESPGARKNMDPLLIERLDGTLKKYRERAEKGMAEAAKLAEEGDKDRTIEGRVRYHKAIETYDKVIKEYPFPDVVQKANVKKGEILGKLTGPGR